MATTSNNFTGVGNGSVLQIQSCEKMDYTVSGTFSGSVNIEYSESSGVSWTMAVPNITAASSKRIIIGNIGNQHRIYRFRCTDYTSGTIETSLSDVSDLVKGTQIYDNKRELIFEAKDGVINFPNDINVDGDIIGETKLFNRVENDFLIRGEEVVLQRCMELEEGVTVTIDDGGELFFL